MENFLRLGEVDGGGGAHAHGGFDVVIEAGDGEQTGGGVLHFDVCLDFYDYLMHVA